MWRCEISESGPKPPLLPTSQKVIFVTVVSGAWQGTQGVVSEMNMNKQTATINLEIFGRETPVELSFADIRKED